MAVSIQFTADATGATQTTNQYVANLTSAFAGIQNQLKQMETASNQSSAAMVQGLEAITHATQATAQATQTMAQVIQRNSAGTAKQFQETAQQSKSLVQNVDALTGAVVAFYAAFQAGGVLGGFIKDVTLTAARTETLGVVLMQVAKNAGVTALEAGTARDRIKALGVTTQEASSITSRFIASNLDLAKAIQLANVARNAAVVADQNTSQALNGLVQGILTMQQETLRTYGIFVNLSKANDEFAKSNHRTVESLTTYEKQQITLNAVIEAGAALNGTYEASLGTVGKQVTSLTRVVEESKNVLGANYLPIFGRLVQAATSLLVGFQQLSPTIQTATAAVVGSAAAVGVLTIAIAALVRVGQALAVTSLFTGWGPVILAIGAATAGVIALSKALSSVGETDPAKVLQQSLSGIDSRIAATQNLLKAQESSLAVMQKQLEQTPESKAGVEIIARQTARVEELRIAVEALQKVRDQVGKPVALPPPKPPTEPPKSAGTGAAEAAAAAQATQRLTRERIEQEKIALDQIQALRARALEQDYTTAVATTEQTKAAQAQVETAFAIRRLDITRRAVLEDVALQEKAAGQIRDAEIAAIHARDTAAQASAVAPGAAAEAQLNANKRSAASAIELQTVVLNAENAKQLAAQKRTEAEAAYEKGVSAVVRGERAEQIRMTEAQLQRDAQLRQQALQGQESILSAETALVQAQVDGLVLTREEGLSRTQAIEQQALVVRRNLLEEQFQDELGQLERRVAENKATEDEITALRSRHTQDLQVMNLREQTQAQEHRTQLLQGWIDWVKDVQGALGNFLFRWADGQVRSIKDVLLDMKSYFFHILADMVAKAATSQIIIPIVTTVLGGLGTGGTEGLSTIFQSLGLGTGTPGAAQGVDTLGTVVGGVGFLSKLFGPQSAIGGGLEFLSDSFVSLANRVSDLFGGPAFASPGLVASLPEGAASLPPGVMALNPLQSIGGLIAGITGLVGALKARDTGGQVIGGLGGALGFAGMVPGPQQPFLLAASAIVQLLGPMIAKMFSPAGPRFALGGLGGLGIGTGPGGLQVTGDVTSRIGRAERLPGGVDVDAIQGQLATSVANMVKGMVQAINTAALKPDELLGSTQKALNDALAGALTINSSSAKNFQADMAAQLKFVSVQIGSFFLDPLVEAFSQLESSDIDEQIKRLPGTTAGMTQVFKAMNDQLNELSKVANTDVLRQLSSVRNRVEDFGNSLADSARVVATSIVDSLVMQMTDQAENLLDMPLAKQITEFSGLLTQSLQAVTALRATVGSLESVGLDAGGVETQLAQLTKTMIDTSASVSSQIVTGALQQLTTDIGRFTTQAVSVQAVTVNSLFADSLNALAALQTAWRQLNEAGIDSKAIQEQFTKLLGGMLEGAFQVITEGFSRGSFADFLTTLVSLPPALTALNPTLQRLQDLGKAFAQLSLPLEQAIQTRQEELRTPAERVSVTTQAITDLQKAIAEAGDSAEKALPLYAKLGEQIQANAAAQIDVINEQAQAQTDFANTWAESERERVQQVVDVWTNQVNALAESQRDEVQKVVDVWTDEVNALADSQRDALQKVVDVWTDQVNIWADAQTEALQRWVDTTTQMVNDWADSANTAATQLSRVNEILMQEMSPAQQQVTLVAQKAALQPVIAAGGPNASAAIGQLIKIDEQLLGIAKQSDDLKAQKDILDELSMVGKVLTDTLVEMTGQSDPFLAQLTIADTSKTLLGYIAAYQKAMTEYITTTQQAGLENLQIYQKAQLDYIQGTQDQRLRDIATWQAILVGWIQGTQDQRLRDIAAYEAFQLDYIKTTQDRRLEDIRKWQEDTVKAIKVDVVYQLKLVQLELQKLFVLQYKALTGIDLPTPEAPVYPVAAARGGLIGLASGQYYAHGGIVQGVQVQQHRFTRGGLVNAMLEPRERVISPPLSRAQQGALLAVNDAFPRFAMGGMVPGSGVGDTVPARLAVGSIVLNQRASDALGRFGMAQGGLVRPMVSHAPTVRFESTRVRPMQTGGTVQESRQSPPATSVGRSAPVVNIHIAKLEVRNEQDIKAIIDGITRQLAREWRTSNDKGPFR